MPQRRSVPAALAPHLRMLLTQDVPDIHMRCRLWGFCVAATIILGRFTILLSHVAQPSATFECQMRAAMRLRWRRTEVQVWQHECCGSDDHYDERADPMEILSIQDDMNACAFRIL